MESKSLRNKIMYCITQLISHAVTQHACSNADTFSTIIMDYLITLQL